MIRNLSLAVILGSCLATQAAAAALEPVHSDGMLLPAAKPDLALVYPSESVDIAVPAPRPDLQSILPRATRTVSEMYLQQTGAETGGEAGYSLKSGEGLATLLRRAGYDRADAAKAIEAVSGRASLRALPVGLKVRVARDGFAFTAKNGRDIYAIRDPEEG